MTVIIVTGTPGTGKTTIAKIIAKKLNYTYIDVNKIIEQKKLCEEYDNERDCTIIDADKLADALIARIKKGDNLIIDSHMSHNIPKEHIKLCIITRCQLKTLKERLDKRKYSEKKIKENLDAEIFENCITEAEEAGHTIMIVDTTHTINEDNIIETINEKI
jgi:adenylate kinase